MSHEVFVNMETAKQLKQAGFDWEVRAHYCEKETNALLYDGYLSAKWNSELYDGCLSAPTQAVAQRWLREVKHFEVEPHVLYNPKRYRAQVMVSGKMCEDGPESETYEIALEAGIRKCLSLING